MRLCPGITALWRTKACPHRPLRIPWRSLCCTPGRHPAAALLEHRRPLPLHRGGRAVCKRRKDRCPAADDRLPRRKLRQRPGPAHQRRGAVAARLRPARAPPTSGRPIRIAPEWLHDEDAALIRESNANHIRFMHVAGSPPMSVRLTAAALSAPSLPVTRTARPPVGPARRADARCHHRLPQPPVHSVLGGRQQLDLPRAHAGDAAAQAAAGPPRRAFYGLPHPEHRGGRQRERVCRHHAEPPRRPLFVAARSRYRNRVQPRGSPPPHLGRFHPAGFRLPQPLGRQGRQKSCWVRLQRSDQ